MLEFLRKRRVDKLWTEAQELLDKADYETVLEIAQQMERERHSGAFDLAAQAYVGLGRRPEAIAALERAVEIAPEAWLNWELLGNYYSDDARFEAAADAYEQALGCKNVRVDSIRANKAILAQRRGDLEEALRLVESIDAPELALHKASVQARGLLDTGHAREALHLCRSVHCPDELSQAQKQHLASLCVTQANAMTALDASMAAIDAHLRAALSAIPNSEALLTCYRQFQNRTSDDSRLFSVVADFELDPKLRGNLRAVGFLRSGQAIADNPEEAVAFFRELEDDRLLVLAEAPEVCELSDSGGPLKGITVRTPRIYYRSRD